MNEQNTQNPYRDGCNYNKLFSFWMKLGIATRQQLFDKALALGIVEGSARSIVNIMLSPRDHALAQDRKHRGNIRGNPCARGAFYFAKPIKVKGETKQFELAFRPADVVATLVKADAQKREKVRLVEARAAAKRSRISKKAARTVKRNKLLALQKQCEVPQVTEQVAEQVAEQTPVVAPVTSPVVVS